MSLLLVKNITREGPGILESILKDKDITYHIADLDAGDSFPDPEKYSAVIVFGGPDSANDSTEKMTYELAMIKKAVDADIPYLGICLGMQTLVKACGGSVYANPVKEIGFRGEDGEIYSVDIEEEHFTDPIFRNMENQLKIFHLHGETVELPDSMQLLATGKYCRNQIVKKGNSSYGIQGHFELTREMFNIWLANDPELMELDRNTLLQDFDKIAEEYERTGYTLFSNFLWIAGLL